MQIAGLLLPMMLLQTGGKLQIKDTKAGSGPEAGQYDLLTMDYTGKLADGTVFDTSKKPGAKPFQFVLDGGQVIKGWDQGIKGMKVGGTRTLVIPPDLAYGPRGAGAAIPPNATLTFEVELKGIHKCDYTIIKKGTGPGAKALDSIEVNFSATLANGTKLFSTYDKGKGPQPVTLGRTQIPIQGWAQAFYGMKAGEKRKVTIPPEFGLGSRTAANIPANSTLIIEIEMTKFLK